MLMFFYEFYWCRQNKDVGTRRVYFFDSCKSSNRCTKKRYFKEYNVDAKSDTVSVIWNNKGREFQRDEFAQANKIRREIIRLSTGTSSVAPLICKGSQCAFKNTCVPGDTVLSGPKDKKMKDVQIGDILYSFNIETNRIEKDTVTAKVNNGFKTVYLITTWYGKKLKVTSNHLVLTVNKKFYTSLHLKFVFKLVILENTNIK